MLFSRVPLVSHDPALRGRGAAQKGAVSQGRNGWEMIQAGAGKHGSRLEQGIEARRIVAAEPGEIVVTELVYDDRQDQFGFVGRRRCENREREQDE